MRSLGWRMCCIGLSPVLLLAGSRVWAEQWYFEPDYNLRVLYDDNVGLSVSNPAGSGIAIASASAKTGRRSQVLDIGIDGKLTRRQYFNDPQRNSNDISLDASLVKATRRDRIQLDARLDLDSTTTSELTTSGLTRSAKRRVKKQLAPSWRRQLTPQWGLTVDASYQDVSYRDAALTGLVDYTYKTLGFTTDYQFDARTQLIAQLTFSRYKTDQTSVQSDTTGGLAGVAYTFSPTWSVRGLLGLRRSETSQQTLAGTVDTSGTGYLADILSTKKFQTGTLTVSLNQSTNPSGNGELLDSRQLSVGWNQKLSARWTWSLNASQYQNESSAGTAGGTNNRTYLNLSPAIRYKMDREWTVSAAYRYRYQKYEVNPDAATSNAVLMTLTYRPLTRK